MKVDTRYDPAYTVVGERVDPFYQRELYLSTDVILDLRDIAAEAIECTTSFDSNYATDYERSLLKRMATQYPKVVDTCSVCLGVAEPPEPCYACGDKPTLWPMISDISTAWIEYLLWVPSAQRYLEITWRLEQASLGTPYEDLFCVSQECLDSRTAIGERAPQPWDWIYSGPQTQIPEDRWEIPTQSTKANSIPEEWARPWYEKYWMQIIKSPAGEVGWSSNSPELHNKPKQFRIEGAFDTNKIEKESAVWTNWPDITPQVVGPAMLFYVSDPGLYHRRIIINRR